MRPALVSLALVILTVSLASPVPARPEASPDQACPAIDPPAAPLRPAVRASIDPETGRLRPSTAEERHRLAGVRLERAGRTYEVKVLPDGTRVVELDDAFFMSVVATRQPGGTLRYRCRTDRLASSGEKK